MKRASLHLYDAVCRVFLLGSPSKVVLATLSCGVLIAICIGSFETSIQKIMDLGQPGFYIEGGLVLGEGISD